MTLRHLTNHCSQRRLGRVSLSRAFRLFNVSAPAWLSSVVRPLASMRTRVRIIFLVHAIIAAYCVTCGLLDTYGHFHSWLIPGVAVFYLLLASAVLLPIVAAVSVAGTGYKHPVILVCTHIAMGAGQFFFGLAPLVS